MLWGLVIAAIAAIWIVLSTRLAVIRAKELGTTQGLLSDAKDRQLQTDLKAKDIEIGNLRVKADATEAGISEANQKAAEANLLAEQEHLARVKIEERIGGWKLSKDAQNNLSKALKPFAGTHFSLAANPVEEPFVEMVDQILRDAGWIREAPLDNDGHAATVLLSNKAMVAFSSGLSVVISQDEWGVLSPAANAYKQTLGESGFTVQLIMAVPPANKIAPNVLKFNIGKRE
jgi:hypothetical protein